MKTDRMFKCLLRMLGGNKLTSTELAEELEVSRRSVQRYMEALENAGFPIIATTGVNGGYSLPEDFPHKGALFSAEEYSEIRDSILSGDMPDEIKQRIIGKLSDVSEREEIQPTLFSDGENKDIMRIIRQGLEQKRCIDIEYIDRDEDTSLRTVEPHCRFYREGRWYLYAYCREREGFRIFRVGRIKHATLSDNAFKQRAFVLETALWLLPSSDSSFTDVTLLADECVYDRLVYLFGRDSITPYGTRYLVNVNEPDDKTLVRQLLSFGANIDIIAPDEIKQAVRSVAERIVAKY